MSGLIQAFTQYSSLDRYLEACFSLVVKKEFVEIPSYYLRNDVNHFIHLVTQWGPVKNSIYPSTKEIITRAMGLLVCSTIGNAEKILEALFDIILSKYDGFVENSETLIPCYKAKRYLQSLITSTINITSILEKTNENEYQVEEEENITDTTSDNDITDDDNIHIMNFKEWTQSIADRSRAKVDSIKGN